MIGDSIRMLEPIARLGLAVCATVSLFVLVFRGVGWTFDKAVAWLQGKEHE